MYVVGIIAMLSFWGCAQPVEPTQNYLDQQAYLDAMALPMEHAVSKCKEIVEEELQGECIWFLAKAHASKNRNALTLCSQEPSEKWRQVCIFDTTDMMGLVGEQADTACASTGEFQERCMIHAILREEDMYSAKYPAGTEQDMLLAIHSRMESLGVTKMSEEPIDTLLTARVLARRFEAGWRSQPQLEFSSANCGQVSREVCVDAYRIAIKQIGKGVLPNPCVYPMPKENVQQSKLPVWHTELDADIQVAWKSLCHASYGQQKPPDYESSQKAQNQNHLKTPSPKQPHPHQIPH